MEDDQSDLGDSYVVEAIRGWRYNLRTRSKEFLIKWLNYAEDENTWEPEANLNCFELLNKFVKTLKGKEERCYHAANPDRLTGFQRNAKFVRCVGIDGPHDSDDEGSDKQNKQKFYCLLIFEDSECAEEATIEEFTRNEPKAAFDFLESRLVYKSLDEDD